MGAATAAVIVGGVLVGGAIVASANAAGAAENAAQAQKRAAEEALEFQKQTQARALQLAQASPGELASIQGILALQQKTISEGEKALAKDRELLDAVDPALKESGKQALELLQGKEAASLNVIRRQRENQRQRLEETLKNRLGAGYETSTAGNAALSAFDQQTDETLQGAQERTMGALLGLSAQVRPDMVGKTGQLYSTAANIGSIGLAAQQNIQARQVNAITGNRVDFSDYIGTAGAPWVGDYQTGQSVAGLLGPIGGGLIGGGLGGPGAAMSGSQAGGGGGGYQNQGRGSYRVQPGQYEGFTPYGG